MDACEIALQLGRTDKGDNAIIITYFGPLLVMATGIASQVILHPTASHTLKLLGTTLGRDKVKHKCHHYSGLGLTELCL